MCFSVELFDYCYISMDQWDEDHSHKKDKEHIKLIEEDNDVK